jgi:hypothetical protein
MRTIATALIAIAFVAVPWSAAVAQAPGSDVVARVQKDGSAFVVHVEFSVPATVDETWEVITDYDRMAQIVSSIDASKIVKREGNKVEVEQKSRASAGPIKVTLQSLREVELFPNREIRSRLLKGDAKSSDFTTKIVGDGPVLKVVGDGRFVPGGLAAAAITTESVEAQTKRQYQELRDEILRRKAKEPPPPCLLAKNCAPPPG